MRTIQIPAEQFAQLEDAKKQTGLSKTILMKWLIEVYLPSLIKRLPGPRKGSQ